MSDKKQTFIDPKTGEEIESTRLARYICIPIDFLSLGAIASVFLFFLTFPAGLSGLKVSVVVGLAGGFIAWIFAATNLKLNFQRQNILCSDIHDIIARTQHFRRQRILQRKLAEEEWRGVPDKALSQANPNGPPQPTKVSLSRADSSEEEKSRLTIGVDEQSANLEGFVNS